MSYIDALKAELGSAKERLAAANTDDAAKQFKQYVSDVEAEIARLEGDVPVSDAAPVETAVAVDPAVETPEAPQV